MDGSLLQPDGRVSSKKIVVRKIYFVDRNLVET